MKLYANCPYCKKTNSFRAFVSDRGELIRSKGETVEIDCKHCGSSHFTKIDDIYAKKSFLAIIISAIILVGGLASILIGVFNLMINYNILIFSSGIIAIPFAVYSIIDKQDKNRVNRFNSFKVRK